MNQGEGHRAWRWPAFAVVVGTAVLPACGARTSISDYFSDGDGATDGAGASDGAGGTFGAGASLGSGGSAAGPGLPILLPHAPDPRLEAPTFCTLDSWCGSNADFVAISGTSETDIWIAANRTGNLSDPDAPFDPDEPQRTAILHWDGFEWTATQLGPEGMPLDLGLRSITAGAPDDVWAVAEQGWVLDFDGSSWAGRAHWVPGNVPSTAIAKFGDDVWEVGRAPDFWWHSEGGLTISPIIPSETGLSALSAFERGFWGVGPDIIGRFAAGEWTVEPNEHAMASIWGASDEVAFAAGNFLGVLGRTQADGSWFYEQPGGLNSYRAVWGRSAVDVWAVGDWGAAAYFDGVSWQGGLLVVPQHLNGVWGTADHVWVVGDDGTFLSLEDDGSWQSSHAAIGELRTLWGAAPDDVWAAGEDLIHWNGSTWHEVAHPDVPELLSLSGTSSSDVWAVGRQGTLLHWDGSSWTEVGTPTMSDVTSVWSRAPDDVWAVDLASEILHFDGQAWSAEFWDGPGPLLAIGGTDADESYDEYYDMVVVAGPGPAGTARIYGWGDSDGSSWSFEYFPSGSPAYGVVFSDGKNLWTGGGFGWGTADAVGQYPKLDRWDGFERVENLEPDPITYGLSDNPIVAGWAQGPDDVWIALPHLMHWDGTTWTHSSVGGSAEVRALFGVGQDLWAITDDSNLVRRSLP